MLRKDAHIRKLGGISNFRLVPNLTDRFIKIKSFPASRNIPKVWI